MACKHMALNFITMGIEHQVYSPNWPFVLLFVMSCNTWPLMYPLSDVAKDLAATRSCIEIVQKDVYTQSSIQYGTCLLLYFYLINKQVVNLRFHESLVSVAELTHYVFLHNKKK